MKTNLPKSLKLKVVGIFMLFTTTLFSQGYLIGPVNPAVGTNANYTSHNHFDIFNVLSPTGIFIDSLTIYPATASSNYTIVIQNSSSVVITSYAGISTVGSNQAERIKVNLFVPTGTGYRIGLTTGSVGMLRNSTGIAFPYTVPNVMTFTGATYSTTYWYYFYNIRIRLPASPTDAGLTKFIFPSDSICSGNNSNSVMLKNYGPHSLTSVSINWKVNNVTQPVYNWTGSLAVNDSILVNIGNYQYLSSTNYNLIAFISNVNNLTDSFPNNDTATQMGITVLESPQAIVTPTGPISFCQNDSIILNANIGTGLNYQWVKNAISIPGETSHSLVVKLAGSYRAIVTNANSCSSESNIVVATSIAAPIAIATAQGSTIFCKGDSVVLMANSNPSITYIWQKDGVDIISATSTFFTAKETGLYTVVTTNSQLCSTISNAINVTVKSPIIDLGLDKNICPNHILLLDAGAGMDSYLWSNGAITQTIQVDSSGFGPIGSTKEFHVTVTQQGCSNSDTIILTLVDCTSISEINAAPMLKIYPNPTTGVFNIEIADNASYNLITIANNLGQIVYSKQISTINGNDFVIDLSKQPKGIYFINFKSDVMNQSYKLIIN